MSVTYTEFPERKLVEIFVDGRVTREDFEELAPKFEAFVETHGTIRLLEVIDEISGFDTAVLWKGAKLDFKVIPHISHCAVVGDLGWLSPVSKAVGALVSTKLRTFERDELAEARAWLVDPNA